MQIGKFKFSMKEFYVKKKDKPPNAFFIYSFENNKE